MAMVLQSVLILGGVGLTFAILIALANHKLKVWEDPRIDAVAGMLPNVNCGACGLPGCRAFAEEAVAHKIEVAKCNVLDAAGVSAVASYLGVEGGTVDKKVARVCCGGGSDMLVEQAEYRGLSTCAAASAVAGGGKGCTWGCLGLADCKVACTFDAIVMNEFWLPVVDVEKCTACGDCVDACPKDLFVIMPLAQHLFVQCRNLIAGDDVLAQCKAACTACGRCVQDAGAGLISVATGVAVIDYEKAFLADHRAIERCPTDSIVWLEGVQFGPARRAERSVLT